MSIKLGTSGKVILKDGKPSCTCCSATFDPVVELHTVSVSQVSHPSTCGFAPGTSDTDTAYSPDAASLGAAACTKHYLQQTITHKDGHTETITATLGEDGSCSISTPTCSGAYSETYYTRLKYTSVRQLTPGVTSADAEYDSTRSATYETTYAADCSTSQALTSCSGTCASTERNYATDYDNLMYKSITATASIVPDLANGDCSTYSGTTVYNNYSPPGEKWWYDPDSHQWVSSKTTTYESADCPLFLYPSGGADSATVQIDENTVTQSPPLLSQSSVTLSSENTASVLTPPSLPAFPAFTDCGGTPTSLDYGQGTSATAYSYTDCDDSREASLQHVRYRIAHSTTTTCYLKVRIKKTTQAYTQQTPNPSNPCYKIWTAASSPTEEIIEYLWTGSGCESIADPLSCAERIYSTPVELIASSNQSVTITLLDFTTTPPAP